MHFFTNWHRMTERYWRAILQVIRKLYSSVLFAVKFPNGITDSFKFESTVGVKQGCILSPMFFNIFLSDLPAILILIVSQFH